MIWHYITEYEDGHPVSACFIRAPGRTTAVMTAISRGLIGIFSKTDVRALPRLQDQIPDRFLDRRLELEDLQELDIYCGGDGTGTKSVDERVVPWM